MCMLSASDIQVKKPCYRDIDKKPCGSFQSEYDEMYELIQASLHRCGLSFGP